MICVWRRKHTWQRAHVPLPSVQHERPCPAALAPAAGINLSVDAATNRTAAAGIGRAIRQRTPDFAWFGRSIAWGQLSHDEGGRSLAAVMFIAS